MAFKMKGDPMQRNFPSDMNPAPSKKIYGTSTKDLSDLSFQERSKYKSWKKSERQSGKKGAYSDNTYEAFLNSKKNQETKDRKKLNLGIGDFFKNLFKPAKPGKRLLPSTIAEKLGKTSR
jgi:hypothetical protein